MESVRIHRWRRQCPPTVALSLARHSELRSTRRMIDQAATGAGRWRRAAMRCEAAVCPSSSLPRDSRVSPLIAAIRARSASRVARVEVRSEKRRLGRAVAAHGRSRYRWGVLYRLVDDAGRRRGLSCRAGASRCATARPRRWRCSSEIWSDSHRPAVLAPPLLGGVDRSGCIALCDRLGTSRVTAQPETGCGFFEREPGADGVVPNREQRSIAIGTHQRAEAVMAIVASAAALPERGMGSSTSSR
jgi:hypothetical protein